MRDPGLSRVSARGAGQAVGISTGGPLLVLFYGFPLWWYLGLGGFAFVLASVPMAVHLWRVRHELLLPRGFAIWALFLLTVLVSGLMLPASAPFAIGSGSVLTYTYRLGLYLSATIALLYVGNLGPRWVSARRVPNALAFMFVVVVAGGVLGVLFPDWEATSVLERVLPPGLASNTFLNSLVHLDAADTETILGSTGARPKAPFADANTWGANFSAFLPFFVYAWCRRSSGWRLLAAPVVLMAGAYVVVATLNRALWATLAVGALYAGVQAIRLHRWRGVVAVGAVAVAGAVLVVAAGLPTTIVDRFEHPHSDDRRTELALKTAQSVALGSPVVGFGNTRDVRGNFSSIAGGSTPECEACGVPPFGTQGQFWLVLFAQGVVGAIAFVWFLLYRMARHIRARDLRTVTLLATPLFLLLQLLFYDSLGVPLFATMIALGLMWASGDGAARLEARGGSNPATSATPPGHAAGTGAGDPSRDSVLARTFARRVARGAPVVAAVALAFLLAGTIATMRVPRTHVATVDVLVPNAPVHISVDGTTRRAISIDTEAQRALSDDAMTAITQRTGDTDPRASVVVAAHPLTKVLELSYSNDDADLALAGAVALGEEYVRQRAAFLRQRSDEVIGGLESAEVQEKAALGITATGQSARQRWATTLSRHEGRLAAAVTSMPAPADVVRVPSEASEQDAFVHVARVSALMLGILAGLLVVRAVRGGGARHA